MELWKSLAFIGYPNYRISNEGYCIGPSGPMKGHVHRGRHITVLCNDMGRHTYSTRLLVAMCFLPNPNNLQYVQSHSIDPEDNRVANLYWSKVHSRSNAKLTAEQVTYIKHNCIKGDRKYGLLALAARFGVADSTIRNILSGKTWKE